MKEFSWSFSRLNKFEQCGLQHYEIDVLKNYREKPNEQMAWGDSVHQAMHGALARSQPLPDSMRGYQPWVDRVKAGPGVLLVEQKYAITRQFSPTGYFANNCWYRGIGDAVRIDGPVGLVLDWKTGKVKPESVQLMLMAQCLFSYFPEVQKVRSEFVWLQHDSTTPEVYDRRDMATHWATLMPRVNALETATKTGQFHPHPSGLCKNHCPVQKCIYWGKGGRGR